MGKGINTLAQINNWFFRGNGKAPRRRSRHIKSQMKFFSSPRYRKSADNALWKFSNKKRDGMGWN